jgi:hypothetical protein
VLLAQRTAAVPTRENAAVGRYITAAVIVLIAKALRYLRAVEPIVARRRFTRFDDATLTVKEDI